MKFAWSSGSESPKRCLKVASRVAAFAAGTARAYSGSSRMDTSGSFAASDSSPLRMSVLKKPFAGSVVSVPQAAARPGR